MAKMEDDLVGTPSPTRQYPISNLDLPLTGPIHTLTMYPSSSSNQIYPPPSSASTPPFLPSLKAPSKKLPSSKLLQDGYLKQKRRPGRNGEQEIHPLAGRGRREDPSKRGRGYSSCGGPDQCHAKGTIQQPPPLLHRLVRSNSTSGQADRPCRNTCSNPRSCQGNAHRQR